MPANPSHAGHSADQLPEGFAPGPAPRADKCHEGDQPERQQRRLLVEGQGDRPAQQCCEQDRCAPILPPDQEPLKGNQREQGRRQRMERLGQPGERGDLAGAQPDDRCDDRRGQRTTTDQPQHPSEHESDAAGAQQLEGEGYPVVARNHLLQEPEDQSEARNHVTEHRQHQIVVGQTESGVDLAEVEQVVVPVVAVPGEDGERDHLSRRRCEQQLSRPQD